MENRTQPGSQDITESEYLAELRRLGDDGKVVDQNALTTAELAKLWDKSDSHTRYLIRNKIAKGQLERVWKRVPGMRELIEAYRPKRSPT